MPTHPRRARIPEARRRRIAQQIRLLRERSGLASGELAKRAGIDPASMSQIEQAHRVPSLATVLRLADQLGVLPSALLDTEAAPAARTVTSHDLTALSAAFSATLDAKLGGLTALLQAAIEAGITPAQPARENSVSATGASHRRRVARNDRGSDSL